MILKPSVDRLISGQSNETKQMFCQMPLTLKVHDAMMLIAHCSLFFFCIALRCELVHFSLRLAKNKQQCTLSTIQLRVLG